MSTLFVSDLHLDEERPEILELLHRFLDEQLARASALYFLGDLFEAWVGDDDDAPWVEALLQRFRGWTDQGKRLYFLPGNRDFLIGAQFTQRSGIITLPDESAVELHGVRTLLMHGDSLCTQDQAYQALKLKLRSPAWRDDFLSRPLQERREIVKQLRQQSRAAISDKQAETMQVDPLAMVEKLHQTQTQRIIHGHIHQMGTHTLPPPFESGQRLVLGDWSGTEGSYIIADESGCRLQRFSAA